MCKTVEVRLKNGSELAGTNVLTFLANQQEDNDQRGQSVVAQVPMAASEREHTDPARVRYIPCLKEIVDWLIQKYMFQIAIYQNIQ